MGSAATSPTPPAPRPRRTTDAGASDPPGSSAGGCIAGAISTIKRTDVPLDELLKYLNSLDDLCEGARDAIDRCRDKDDLGKLANCLENSRRQARGRQVAARDSGWTSPQGRYARAPEVLIDEAGHDDRRHPGAQGGGSRAGPAVGDDRRHAREEPVVRHGIDSQHAIW